MRIWNWLYFLRILLVLEAQLNLFSSYFNFYIVFFLKIEILKFFGMLTYVVHVKIIFYSEIVIEILRKKYIHDS